MIFRICPWILSFFLKPPSQPGQVALPVALLEAVPAGPILLGFGHGSWLAMQLRRRWRMVDGFFQERIFELKGNVGRKKPLKSGSSF